MDKRVWIAVVLSMLVLFLYPYFIQWYYPAEPAKKQAQQTQVTEAPAAPAVQAPGQEAATPQAPKTPEPVKEELVTVETPLYKAVFSSIGGGVKAFELKKYSETLKDSKTVNLTKSLARPGSFKTQLSVSGAVEDIAFTPSKTSINISGEETAELTLTGTTKAGVTIEKKYSFSAQDYLINTELKAVNTTPSAFNGIFETVLTSGVAGKDATGYHLGPIVYTKDKLIRQEEDEARKSGTGKFKWLGIEDKYFLSAIILKTDATASWVTEVLSTVSSKTMLQFPAALAANEAKTYTYTSFLGPKEYDLLVKQKVGLEEAIEFGLFDMIARPFLVVLNFFQRYLGNYGLAIIILTVIIKVIFYPLTKHSLKSMRDMQKMQPQLAAIKEKYKGDKEKQNKELMELYKRYKINPLGGCLPILLQIPIFIALYEVLYVAIELRHAPFFFWIHDLSDKDPYYITPVIMGATMFIQQKMTPTSVDPTQARIMLFMPIIFTFMFLSFPAGLVLYWLVNNVLSIAQQYYIQKTPSKV